MIKRGIDSDAKHAARNRRFGLASERAVTPLPLRSLDAPSQLASFGLTLESWGPTAESPVSKT